MLDGGALGEWLSGVLGRPVSVTGWSLMSGGAIQQNVAVDVMVDGDPQAWVLRTDAPSILSVSRSRAEEYALLRAAHDAGVTVPQPLALCTDLNVLGRPFFVMRRVDGVTQGHRIVRSDSLGGGRAALVAAIGRELARIHSIRPPRADLDFLDDDNRPPIARFVATQRAALDAAGENQPVIEWGLRHLERTATAAVDETVLCHNDFRTGNLMVDEAGVTGVLDWEFANWGHRLEDIGWFCARCWRFGSAHEAGGIFSRSVFYDAYEAESGRKIDHDGVARWELAATIRWAGIARDQARRHHSGAERNLELALTGHIVPELELDIMRMTGHG